MRRRRLWNATKILLLVLILAVILGPEWPAFQDERHRINAILGQKHFDFLLWELGALSAKAEAAVAGGQRYLDDGVQKRTVIDYLELLNDVRNLESEVASVYADPSIADHTAATVEMQHEIEQLRLVLEDKKPTVEAILQEQVSVVLADQGFDLLGTAWPPVQMHMTPLPSVLIVSPREEIRQIHNIPLEHGLSLNDREEIEESVYDHTDRSALVVGIGGLGIIPSMIFESSSINYLADVVSHEWAHHWLTLRPIGLYYAASPEMRTINETAASLVGEEIGRMVIERFYPEWVIPEDSAPNGSPVEEAKPDTFNLNDALRETRITVDELLANGQVAEAEEYMEKQRQLIWENGYQIRKINQAFFAFYGAYADTPGEQGDDPIGPALLALREDSASLREFMDRISSITSLEALQVKTAHLLEA